MDLKILGIETSCDETGVAIVDENGRILGDILYIQDFIHSKFGGVVPEVAARRHIEVLLPALKSLLEKSKCDIKEIKAIACTIGPGLMGALLTGASFAKSIATSLNLPFIGVDHLEAHINAVFLEKKVEYPFIGVVISGGHTSIFFVEGIGKMELLGKTLDDAAGEALDKAAKALGLGYPGGPIIDKLAKKGNPDKYKFPRAMEKTSDLNTSFSGLKTALITLLKKEKNYRIEDICASFQEAVLDTIFNKIRKALEIKKSKKLVIAGGVASNSRLREEKAKFLSDMGIDVNIPSPRFCTDNGAMVAYTGLKYLQMGYADSIDVDVYTRWRGLEIGKKIRTTLSKG